MAFGLPDLPYERNALAPILSEETLDYHYGKHHATYVNNLNKFVENDPTLQNKSLEEIILTTEHPGVFNNAAQVWNHTFYWNGLTPERNEPSDRLKEIIAKQFQDVETFKEQFTTSATTNFGSGWTWLVHAKNGQLKIVNTGNAGCPLTDGDTPLLTCDVWEHAYYIDYRNARPQYLKGFWELVNWNFVEQNVK